MDQALTRRARSCSSLAALLLMAVGCTGDVANDGTSPPPTPTMGSPNGTAGAPSTPAPTSTVPGAPAPTSTVPGNPPPPATGNPPIASPPITTCTTTPSVPPAPLRRLTRFEYANSVKSLLNVDTSAASSLPVDEITNGYNNNVAVQTVSALHAEKYVALSETFAKEAVKNLATLTGCDAAAKGEDVCAAEFAKSFGRRAFRRPTTAADEQALMTAYAAGKTGGTYAEGIEVMIRAALQSPHFLFRLETTAPAAAAGAVPLSQFELATRLSYLLWASGPDDALLDAAGRNELSTKEQVATRARAMLQDPKGRVALNEFYSQWIGTSRLDITSKNTTTFPAFNDAVRADMTKELPAFLDYVLFQGDHKLKSLFTAPVGLVSSSLSPLYGMAAPASAAGQIAMLPDSQGRAGIFTLAAFLSVQAHPDQTSPVLRGKFVRGKVLCQPPSPPPDNVDISPPETSEAPTARERLALHLSAGSGCSGCHMMMDPIGLAFENFDAVGQYRTQESGQTIDVSGEILNVDDPALTGAFVGVRELAQKLAASEMVQDCLATQWFRFGTGRTETGIDSCSLATLQDAFSAAGGDLIELAVALTQTEAFWYRAPSAP
jgi:hypothetical protein